LQRGGSCQSFSTTKKSACKNELQTPNNKPLLGFSGQAFANKGKRELKKGCKTIQMNALQP